MLDVILQPPDAVVPVSDLDYYELDPRLAVFLLRFEGLGDGGLALDLVVDIGVHIKHIHNANPANLGLTDNPVFESQQLIAENGLR